MASDPLISSVRCVCYEMLGGDRALGDLKQPLVIGCWGTSFHVRGEVRSGFKSAVRRGFIR